MSSAEHPLFRSQVLDSNSNRLHGEVVFTQPLSTKLFVGALFIIIAIGAIWVSMGTYARIETVPGVLVTTKPSTKIMGRQPGTVTSLLVKEGTHVTKGDKLLIINSDREVAGGGNVAGRNLDSLDVRRQLSEAQIGLANSRATTERARLAALINSAESQAANLRGQIELQEQVVASNRQIFDQVTDVVERGFVSKIEYERRRQTLLGSQQNLASLRERLTANLSEASQARSLLASVSIDAAQGIAQIQNGIETLAAEGARLEGEQSYVVTAPISGRVTALAIGTGRSVNPALPLMVIVPTDSELTAELYAPSRAVGFVEKGKEARILYDAFPYQRFGSFEGRVDSISRIAVDPRDTELPFPFEEPVYRVKVTLDQQSVDAFGGQTPLQAGMTLKANIVLERQSFLAWILQPLNAVLNRSS